MCLFMGMEKRGCSGAKSVLRGSWWVNGTDGLISGEMPKEVM